MESILWALDLVALVVLCRWAIAQDRALPRRKPSPRER